MSEIASIMTAAFTGFEPKSSVICDGYEDFFVGDDYEDMSGEEDELGFDYDLGDMGAVRRVPARRQQMRRGNRRASPIPGMLARPALLPTVPGVPQQAMGVIPIGLEIKTFPSLAVAGTELIALGRVERPFQGIRMIAGAFTDTGAVADQSISVSSIFVGDNPVMTGVNPIPLLLFRTDATYSMLSFPAASVGNTISVRFRLGVTIGAAPATITVVSTITGRSIVA